MIYVDTKDNNVQIYFNKEFSEKYNIKNVNNNFFDFKEIFDIKDILILDIDQFNSPEEIIEIFNTIPKALKVIAFLDEPKLAHGAFLIKKGFKSYIGKKTNKDTINQALKTVIDGNIWLYPQLMNYIINYISIESNDMSRSKYLDLLTTKEQNVANFVSQGYSNKDIAQNMDIQIVTVKKHISSIFIKLNVKDRVALAILLNSQ